MFKKLLTGLIVAAMACSAAIGQPSYGTVYHEIQVVDEEDVKVTDITSISIYNPDTTTESTIYAGRNATLEMTNPVTTTSDNTTLSNGYMSWWGPDGYDFSMTDGTNVHTNSGHRTRTSSEGRIHYPSYLTSISSTTYDDGESITLGTGADWVINAGTTDDLLTFVPATDGAVFRIGTSGTTKNADFEVYTGTGTGLLINEGTSTFGILGLTTNINVDNNYATNINSGTSTGAITIGSGTSGAWAIDGTTTGAINADDSMAITVSAGTIGIASTGGDLTIDATDKSVIIDGGEAAADAVTITATGTAGGIDITSLGDIDITTTGASGEDITIANTGGSVNVTATEAAEDAIVLTSTGGIDFISADNVDFTHVSGATDENFSIVLSGATASSIIITSSGTGADAIDINTSAGGIDIDMAGGAAGEDFSVTTATSITMTATENAAQTIHLQENGGTGGTITLYANQGTSTTEKAASVQLLSDDGSIELWSGLNGADAINIMCDGDTASGITVFNDTGTGDESIVLLSDLGGITVHASAGSVDIEAVGGTDGDIGINAGDDMTITAAGDLTFAITGTTTLPDNQLRRAVVEVGADEMDNLAATQKELVASPGASAYLEFVSAVFALDWGTTAWTEPSAPDDLCIRYTDGSGAIVSELLDATGFATATGDVIVALNPVSDIQAGTTAKLAVAKASCVDQALVLDNTGGEWTNSGDSIVQVIVYYRIHTLTELGL